MAFSLYINGLLFHIWFFIILPYLFYFPKLFTYLVFVWYGKDDINQLVRTVLKIVFSTPYLTFVGLITLLSPLRLEKIPFVNNLKESWY